MPRKMEDLTGKKFGKLIVKEYDRTDEFRNIYWKCICDCGNEAIVRGADLRAKNTTSCNKCSLNKFIIFEDYIKGITRNGIEFIFDIEDYEKISKYTWSFSQGYIGANADYNAARNIATKDIELIIKKQI